MKKSFFTLVFILIIIMGLLSVMFYFKGEKEHSRDRDEVAEDIQIHFWRNYGNDLENQAFMELINHFERLNPGIKVKMRSIPYSDYEILIRTEFAAGTPPDVLMIDSPNLALYAKTGVLNPLTSFIDESSLNDFPDSTIEGLMYENEPYLMPITESGLALFYNIPLFKEAGLSLPKKDPHEPLTWEEVREMAIEISRIGEEVDGLDPAQGFASGEAAAYFKMPILWQFGAEILSPDGTTSNGYLNSAEAIEALTFYQNLYHEDGVASIEMTTGSFEKNLLGLTVLGSWAVADFQNHYELELDVDFGVAPLPKAKIQAVPNGGWALALSSESNHSEEAWAFIEFLSSYAGMKKYVEITGDIPARISVAEDIPELNQYPMNIFVEQAHHYSKSRPVTPVYPVVSEEIRTLFEEIGIGGKDVKKSVQKAVETIDAALEPN
ncbi:ABC transporter substrate-binding protein [Alkalihalobacillus sp. 1P02AB]|uniref:ABC transporter substrate-binding protein n=1 Tax=Alkalihalobacillus sp. 1P02AB TaxID=3132260 RepID=UPI0039A53CA4